MKVVKVNHLVFGLSSTKCHSSRKQMSRVRDTIRSKSLENSNTPRQSWKYSRKRSPQMLVACTSIIKPESLGILNHLDRSSKAANVLPRLNNSLEISCTSIKTSQSPKEMQQLLEGRISPQTLAATIQIRFRNPNKKEFDGSCQSWRSRNQPETKGQLCNYEHLNTTTKIDMTKGSSESRFLRKRLKKFIAYDFDIMELKKG